MSKSLIASSAMLLLALLAFSIHGLGENRSRADDMSLAQIDIGRPPVGSAAAVAALEATVEGLPETSALDSLPALLRRLTQQPVFLDPRAVDFARLDEDQSVSLRDTDGLPLRAALRQALGPLGLKALPDEDGILITADPARLVHRGIGVSRWINVEEEAEQTIAEALDQRVSLSFIEEPLENALRIIAEESKIPILLDRKALEDTPYTPDTPINLTMENVTLRTLLDYMLSEWELTYTIRREVLSVTTYEVAELYRLIRIYWLEGTGISGDSKALIKSIEALEPDTWKQVGGMSSIELIGDGRSGRPAVLVLTDYRTHHLIDSFLAAARELHLGPDLPFAPLPPSRPSMGFMGGGK